MSINFPKTEEEVIQLWRDIDAFQTQVRLNEGNEPFIFYDGPPFATGLPHYGHLLTSTIKDIIPRYWAMKGYHVPRRFGWDTHGVPIEYEIDKKLGISGRDAVMQMGIEKYNAECRAIVMRYSAEWRSTIERLGRWIDFDNDYKTMDVKFMETCWWVFKQLFDQGSVYRAYQIMPFSTALCTPLSHMESKQNEKLTQDPAIVVAFPVVGVEGYENTDLLIYTTTPWTLPSNLLIAAHNDFEYLVILNEATGRQQIMQESGLALLFKNPKKAKYNVVKKIRGKELIGWKYEPIFKYFADEYSDCFQVIAADYVEEGEGTGLVHQAPAFGQEDYDAAVAAGFITPKRLPPCPVDDKGCFTAEIPEYVGQHVKVADKAILKDLRPTGRLLVESQIMHTDKFCWRSDTQLIRKAVSSWFIQVKDAIPEMLENLEKTNWVPASVKEKRFANWVGSAHDWNVSRNRYWGTPIPLWVSDDFEEVVCVGSRAELKELSGYDGELNDIHRDKVDGITIPSKTGKGMLHRIDEIFDCWFESGSMPYASNHFPFGEETRRADDASKPARFPADFIAEGLDQTRGWFYTLTVLGNKLFHTSPFRNVIVNGIVLAEDGKKMSKRLKNYADPVLVLQQYGADALRLYMINSPVVRGESLRFKESGVKEMVSRVLLALWNSYRFFSEQALLYQKTAGKPFVADLSVISDAKRLNNVMDRWILAEVQSLLKFVEQEMLAYRLYTVVPRLLGSIEQLTNWYIRFNRRRLKGSAGLGVDDTTAAMNTLFQVLFTLTRALAPFIPFITEHIYGLLRPYLSKEALSEFKDDRSVHFLPFPTVQEALFDEVIERKVAAMQKVIQLARTARERVNASLKMPLLSVVVIADQNILDDVDSLSSYVREELNVRDVVLSQDEEKYGIQLEARVDWPTLGKKLKKDVQMVKKALPGLTQAELRRFLVEKKVQVGHIELGETDISIVRVLSDAAKAGSAKKEAETEAGKAAGPSWEPGFADDMIVLLDTTPHPELAEEGLAREIINRVQRLRKKAGLVPADDVQMHYQVLANPENVDLAAVVGSHETIFRTALRGTLQPASGEAANKESLIVEEEQAVGDLSFVLRLLRI
ncbi:isoleucyl-tRNA synthetase [Grosmannia clavigera kw1407]|uniref:Isoleucine--tRNA ligase, cytoplasmic n=1 Tax=Grosmannia clavigera (strain kw1407 / UAMH 11150) TaxID=655863 RepID=F0XTC7_GROCL|nr:isoleucyl-tRNA synthetase [Grosmannia clavigera kw1407]EFW99346.1 isoleucyl-tRNA synthetase [Grosmannia clavigera kw1407]